MIAGRLTKKRGIYHIMLSYKDDTGKRKEKWFSTGLSVTGNKKKAESMLIDYRTNFDISTMQLIGKTAEPATIHSKHHHAAKAPTCQPNVHVSPAATTSDIKGSENDPLFSDYLLNWLEKHRINISPATYASYLFTLNASICPYFRNKGLTLRNLTADDIDEFYEQSLKTVSANTVKHYHANIRKALQVAFTKGLVVNNVADMVTLPRVQQFIGSYYNSDELLKLHDCARGEKIELAVLLASYYGLRRSEIVGLKWSAIDLTYKTITIRHTVTAATIDGKEQLYLNDRGKTKKSYRTLPLLPEFEKILLDYKSQTQRNRAWAGKAYDNTYSEYIYVDELGKLIRPDYISSNFQLLLNKHNLRKIRFHDLRHSCATLLRHEGVPMEDIQKWLGHSNITTTEKIYAHFEDERHWHSANKIATKLSKQKSGEMEM